MIEHPRNKPFTIHEGTPMITFIGRQLHKMLPYHTLCSCDLLEDGSMIILQFQDWIATIRGHGLSELWAGLELQDVRQLWLSGDSSPVAESDDCRIIAIDVQPARNPEDTM